MSLPKTVKIVVNKGENLRYRADDVVQTPKTKRWRLVFTGGEKKLASSIVDEPNGNPVWNCEVIMTAVNPVDPMVILVIDGKARHVGRVLLDLNQIPKRPMPQLLGSTLVSATLEATKKNPKPAGTIYYWIGVEDYWPANVNMNPSLYKSHSLRNSLSNLSSALFKSNNHDNHSTLSATAKFKQLKDKYAKRGRAVGNRADASSTLSCSRSQLDRDNSASSRYSASNLNGETFSRGSSINSNMRPTGWHSVLGEERQSTTSSYNPIQDDSSDVESGTGVPRGASSGSFVTGTIKKSDSTWTIGEDPETKKPGLISRVRSKVTKSTHNLSEIGLKLRSRANSRGSEIESVAMASPSPFTASATAAVESSRMGTGAKSMNNLSSQLPPKVPKNPFGDDEEQPLEKMGHQRYRSDVSSTDVNDWGRHPEEQKSKPKDEMSRREMQTYATMLEETTKKLQAELSNTKLALERAQANNETAQVELTSVRNQLASLRNRLLADNLTKYLEVEVPTDRAKSMSNLNGLMPVVGNGSILSQNTNSSTATIRNLGLGDNIVNSPFQSHKFTGSTPNNSNNHSINPSTTNNSSALMALVHGNISQTGQDERSSWWE